MRKRKQVKRSNPNKQSDDFAGKSRMMTRKMKSSTKEGAQVIPSNFSESHSSIPSVPEVCLVCDNPIKKNSVLFHCECVVVFCQDCAPYQVCDRLLVKDTPTINVIFPFPLSDRGSKRNILFRTLLPLLQNFE